MGRTPTAATAAPGIWEDLKPDDLIINTFHSGLNCPCSVKVIHTPTGLVGGPITHMSYTTAKDQALEELESKLIAL